MQAQIELKPMFSYSFIPIIVIIILIVIILITLFIIKRKELKKLVQIPSNKEIINIKNKYLVLLQELENNINNNKITNRSAYQKLSSIIRNFIYETTNIKVQNYTLKEIKTINMPTLTELVSEYYDPEFSSISKGNIISSLNKTRMVIEKWN